MLEITVVLLGRRGAKIAMDVARGMDKMHSRHIIHLDLKSPNILLTASGTAKIAVGGWDRNLDCFSY